MRYRRNGALYKFHSHTSANRREYERAHIRTNSERDTYTYNTPDCVADVQSSATSKKKKKKKNQVSNGIKFTFNSLD